MRKQQRVRRKRPTAARPRPAAASSSPVRSPLLATAHPVRAARAMERALDMYQQGSCGPEQLQRERAPRSFISSPPPSPRSASRFYRVSRQADPMRSGDVCMHSSSSPDPASSSPSTRSERRTRLGVGERASLLVAPLSQSPAPDRPAHSDSSSRQPRPPHLVPRPPPPPLLDPSSPSPSPSPTFASASTRHSTSRRPSHSLSPTRAPGHGRRDPDAAPRPVVRRPGVADLVRHGPLVAGRTRRTLDPLALSPGALAQAGHALAALEAARHQGQPARPGRPPGRGHQVVERPDARRALPGASLLRYRCEETEEAVLELRADFVL